MQGVTEVYEIALQLCPNGEQEQLARCVQAAVFEVTAYCGLETLPETLYFLTAKLALLWLNGGEGEVRSLSRGDYSVTYGDGALAQLKKALLPYRKVRW